VRPQDARDVAVPLAMAGVVAPRHDDAIGLARHGGQVLVVLGSHGVAMDV
jgi:hypothetical protein